MSASSFSSLLKPLRGRLSGVIARGVLRLVRDSHVRQMVDVELSSEGISKRLERFENYGLASYPYASAGAGILVVTPRANPDHPVVICIDDKAKRPQGMDEGEVQLYADGGVFVRLRADGSILVKGQARVDVDAPDVSVKGATSLKLESNTLLELKVGTSKISLTPAGITIEGAAVTCTQA